MSNKSKNNVNELGMELGFDVPDWQPALLPSDATLEGRYCRLEPLDLDKHSEQLFQSYKEDSDNRVWVYLPYGPFDDIAQYREWMGATCFNGDPHFYAVIDKQLDRATGVASYLRINPEHGSIEVGHINYSPLLQNTIAATETMYLMMKNAFELGNRRYEWKCNALNEKSCNAARRLGFTYEGTFRQMLVVKGQNRDSAWFSILDKEWEVLQPAFESWLQPENFDTNGNQKQSLSSMTSSILRQLNEQEN